MIIRKITGIITHIVHGYDTAIPKANRPMKKQTIPFQTFSSILRIIILPLSKGGIEFLQNQFLFYRQRVTIPARPVNKAAIAIRILVCFLIPTGVRAPTFTVFVFILRAAPQGTFSTIACHMQSSTLPHSWFSTFIIHHLLYYVNSRNEGRLCHALSSPARFARGP